MFILSNFNSLESKCHARSVLDKHQTARANSNLLKLKASEKSCLFESSSNELISEEIIILPTQEISRNNAIVRKRKIPHVTISNVNGTSLVFLQIFVLVIKNLWNLNLGYPLAGASG